MDTIWKSVKVKPNFKRVAIVVKGLGFDEGALDMINKGFASEVSFHSALMPKQ